MQNIGTRMIPQAKKGDVDAVAQALSTAGTMHALGDRAGALKWLRRATEAAADADADDRTLELAKAAADLASANAIASGGNPPQPVVPSRETATAPSPQAPQAPPSRPGSAPRMPSPLAASSPVAPAPPTPAPITPTSPLPRVAPIAPLPQGAPMAPKPPSERATFLLPVKPRLGGPTVLVDPWSGDAVDDDDDMTDVASEKTRVGVPAYGLAAKTEAPAVASLTRSDDPALRPSQAMRVVVWRAPDGVHVAPRGTHVAAIAVDAILVALDPSADLAAWLTGK